ncbi:P-loop containing nucleoside triphosphate hydrolase [Phytophthora cactorum]|nr:P-loop containing nucleoside triphosphate hydrolase [Phytophthora cactorum]
MADAKAQRQQARRAKIRAALQLFGFSTLRGLQGADLRRVLSGKDTLVLMPTGGGKSLCYQLPALLLPGLVVVVNQVAALRRKHIGVEMLSSLVAQPQRERIVARLLQQFETTTHNIDDERIEMLYTTPETLQGDQMQLLLQQLQKRGGLALFAIDEAHCISSWGHDFRPADGLQGACDVCNPRLNLFRFEEKPVIDKRTERFCRQSIKAIKTRESFTEKKMRTGYMRRDNLINGQRGSYAPEEIKSVVVRGGSKRALAATGFVAVNGNVSSGEEDYDDDEASAVVQAVRSRQRKQDLDDTLDALERAEQASANDGGDQKHRKVSGARAKEAAEEETDDLAKLQKQFGIRPVSDADVQAELQALLAATGSTGGSSPTAESLLFGAGGDEEEDEEAKILRDLQLDGLNLDDEEVESDGHREAKNELRGVLDEVHQTARENHSREAAEMSGKAPARGLKEGGEAGTLTPQRAAQVQALKMEALALKREGKIQDALAKFREAKQLQGQVSSAQGHMANTSSSLAPTVQHDGAGKSERAPNETMLDDGDKDVEVTDEDMQDPEFLAQLAKMGLTEDDGDSGAAGAARNHNVMQQLSALETQIHECKVQAIQLKRQDQIADALACMRKIKELEVKRDELRSSAAISNQSPAVHLATAPAVTESVYHHVAVSSLTSVRLNSGAVPLDESQADSDIDSVSDVEVTAEDMNDPAFAAELRNLGDDDAVSIAPTPLGTSIGTRSISVVAASVLKPTPPSSRLLKAAPSIDEDYLIDAFDESDSEGETNHLTTMAKAVASVEYMSVKAEKARQTALSLKRKGDIQGALESMRRAKQIQNLIDLKQHATDNPEATVGSAQNSATAAKFQEIEQLLVDFGNRAMALAKENLSVNREKASEWLAKIAIKLRRPLKEKEIRLEAVEDLVIAYHAKRGIRAIPTEASNPSSKNAAAMSDDTRSMMKEDQPTSITAELDDPHHLDLIVSYDVVNEELEKVGAKLPSLSGPAAIEWSDRYDSLALKKQLLEIEMQTGKLTLDMYVERLHKRIAEDHHEKELVGADGDSAES